MTQQQRAADIASSEIYMAILAPDFERSQGIEDLRIAISLSKPVVLFSHPSYRRRHSLPSEFIAYSGPKLDIDIPISEGTSDRIRRRLIPFLLAQGINLGEDTLEYVDGAY